jgi:hypothetical protein
MLNVIFFRKDFRQNPNDDTDSESSSVESTSVIASESRFVSETQQRFRKTMFTSEPSRHFRGRLKMKKNQIILNDEHHHILSGSGRDPNQTQDPNHILVQLLSILLPICLVILTFALIYTKISSVLEVWRF